MSAAPPVKRQKTNAVDYLSVIDSLPYRTLGDILAEAGQKYPEIAARIILEHKKLSGDVVVKTTRQFQSQVHSASYILNGKYSRLSCSKQFEKAFRAASEVQAIIKEIGRATPADSSLGTKTNALEALVQVGMSICRGGEELGKEVRTNFQYETCLENTMLRIAKSMAVKERNVFMKQGFESKLAALEREAAGYCVFQELDDVGNVLLSAKEFQVQEDDQDEEEEDEDDDNDGDDDDEEDEDDY